MCFEGRDSMGNTKCMVCVCVCVCVQLLPETVSARVREGGGEEWRMRPPGESSGLEVMTPVEWSVSDPRVPSTRERERSGLGGGVLGYGHVYRNKGATCRRKKWRRK
jgi:hypothetical protein